MQGFNKYYPPDYDPDKHSSLNSYHGKHALGDRARKIDQGILVVRFELPYNIWCNHCSHHVGQGVRHNAEKKQVGSYFSSKIWSFRFKCHLCSGWIEIRTDPQNTRYVVTEGARQKNEVADDPEADGMMVIESSTSLTDQSAPPDPFASLEKTVTQKAVALSTSARLSALYEKNDNNWDDPFAASQKLRASFRKQKGEIVASEGRATTLAGKFGLGERVRMEDLRTPKPGSSAAAEEEEEWERAKRERERFSSEARGKRRREEEGFSIPGATPGPSGSRTKRPRASLPSATTSSRPLAGLPSSSSSRRESLPTSSSRSPARSTSSSKPSAAAQTLHSKLLLATRLKNDPFATSSPPSASRTSSSSASSGRTSGISTSKSAPAGLAGLALGRRRGGGESR